MLITFTFAIVLEISTKSLLLNTYQAMRRSNSKQSGEGMIKDLILMD